MNTAVTIAIVGAGSRGSNYARLAAERGAVVVAVAEPDAERRRLFAEAHGLTPEQQFTTWEDLVAEGRIADAVIVATQDRLHVDPAVAFAELGYDILLEKPMAPEEDEAARIVAAVEAAGVTMAVGHVMRYSAYTRALKELLDDGAVGTVISVEHLEPIGWWHFAHSYVRGNWRSEAASSSMLMAKSSHDLDWLRSVVGQPVTRVSSFGNLMWFRPENKPEGATDRCVTCPLQDTCAYSATTIYGRFLEAEDDAYRIWPLQVLAPVVSPESVREALEDGPYGACVYNGQNDVVDHQVVNLEFADGATASFTATAFTDLDFRKTRVFGSAGWIEGDGVRLRVHDFATDTWRVIDTAASGGASAADGHGGADGELVSAFLAAIESGEPGTLSTPRESFESHRLVWAAEQSRRSGTVVQL